MADEEPKVRLRAYDLNRVFRLKRKIEDDLGLLAMLDVPLRGEDFRVFVDNMYAAVGDSRVPYESLRDSLLHLAGSPVSRHMLHEEGWRIAGNLNRLRIGKHVPPWRTQTRPEWVPLQITDHVPFRSKRGKIGGIFTFRILAGTSCSLVVEKFWTREFARYLSAKLGFSLPWGQLPFQRLPEFMSLRLYGLIEPERSHTQPFFDQVAAPGSVLAYNRKLLKARKRVGFACPKQWDTPCFQCPIGYDRCRCGTHPRTFVRGVCEKCKQERWMDPQHEELRLCMECFIRQQLSRDK